MRLPIYPKTHYVMKEETRASAVASIKVELAWWEAELEKKGRLVESQRIHQRVMSARLIFCPFSRNKSIP